MMPRYFFFGMIEVPFWEYRSGLTVAQIELLTSDMPIVVYKKDENKPKPWENGTVSEDYAKKAYQKWLEKKKKREAEGKNVDVNQVFQKGKRVDFMHYLDTGEQKEL